MEQASFGERESGVPTTFRDPCPPLTIVGMKKRVGESRSFTVFYEEDPAGGFVAFVPALAGCHTQGESLEEAESNVKEAIALYLESLTAHGDPVPDEGRCFQGRVTVPVLIPA